MTRQAGRGMTSITLHPATSMLPAGRILRPILPVGRPFFSQQLYNDIDIFSLIQKNTIINKINHTFQTFAQQGF